LRKVRSIEIFKLLEEIKEKVIGSTIIDFFGRKKLFSLKLNNGYLNFFIPYFFFFDEKPITEKRSKFSIAVSRLISNRKINDISQIDFDRFVVISALPLKLIFKFFDGGNIVLLDDSNKILATLFKARTSFEERKIKIPKNISELKEFEKDLTLIDLLKNKIGLGEFYSKEILKNSFLSESLKIKDLNNYEASSLINSLNRLMGSKKFFLVIKNEKPTISIYFKPEDYLAIEYDSLNSVLKNCFEMIINLTKKKSKEKVFVERNVEEINKEIKNLEEIINVLEENKELFEEILDNFLNYKASELEVSSEEKSFVINFGSLRIKLFYDRNVDENIKYYKNKLAELKSKLLKPEAEEKAWYKNFRYFVSSDGFLVVFGTSSYKNEILIKKFCEKDDLVLHSVIKGSPYALIKSYGKEIPKNTLEEAALMVACYSRAWVLGFNYCDIFYVKPEQLVKESWMPVGVFGIIGEKKFIRNVNLELCLGLNLDGSINCGHERLIKKNFQYIFYLYPGRKNVDEIAEFIEKFTDRKITLNRKLLRFLIPFGRADIYYKANE